MFFKRGGSSSRTPFGKALQWFSNRAEAEDPENQAWRHYKGIRMFLDPELVQRMVDEDEALAAITESGIRLVVTAEDIGDPVHEEPEPQIMEADDAEEGDDGAP